MDRGRKLDAADLLVRARAQMGLSQRDLARRARTSRSVLWAYESGAKSPTVRQLDRLLAECGLQVRAALEPLRADLDEQVEGLLAGEPMTCSDELDRVATSLDQAGVGWALDGATALGVHGLSVTGTVLCVVVRFDEALQRWLRDKHAKGRDVDGETFWGSWLDVDVEEAQRYLGHGLACFTAVAFLSFRVVAELPAHRFVLLELPGAPLDPYATEEDTPRGPSTDRVLPVVSVHEVEQSSPAHAEVLARWRAREAAPGQPVE